MRMPFFIEMSYKKILIIGGGYEGVRRAEKYVKTGAEVIVYSRSFDNRLLELANRDLVKIVKGDVEDEERLERWIQEADMVMVALEKKDYNDKIKRIVQRYRRLLNLANDAEETEVVVPIDSNVGPFRIAITTEGKSSMVAREALHKIVVFLKDDQELIELAELMRRIKKLAKENIPDPKKRMEIYERVFNNDPLRTALRSGDKKKARKILFNILRDEGLYLEEEDNM